MNVVGDPYIVLWVVGTDRYGMRSAPILEEFVPLRPRLDDFSSRIDHNDAVAKLGSYTRRLLADRAPEAVKVVWQFFRQLQLAAVCNEDVIRIQTSCYYLSSAARPAETRSIASTSAVIFAFICFLLLWISIETGVNGITNV